MVEKKDDGRPNEIFAQISESRVGRCIRTQRYTYSVYAPGIDGAPPLLRTGMRTISSTIWREILIS